MMRFLLFSLLIWPAAGTLFAQNSPQAQSYYHFSLAKLRDSSMQYAEAIREFEKALALDAESSQLHFEFARTLLKVRETQRALQEAKKAIELEDENAEAHYLLGQIYRTSLENGDEAMLDRAMAEFERVVQLDPTHAEALFYLGQFYFFRGQFKEAAATFDQFVQIRPQIVKGFNYQARSLIGMAQIPQAISALEDSLRFDPEDLENLELLGKLYEQTGQFEKALQAYQQAAEAAPTIDLRSRIAVALSRLGRFDESIPLLEKIVQETPEKTAEQVELGKALEGARRYNESVAIFEKVLDSDPNNTEANYYLASSLRALGRRPEAIQQVQHLLEMTESPDGNYSETIRQYRNRFKSFLAVLYQEDQQYDKAIALFREINNEQPDDVRATLGLIYALQDALQLPEALELSRKLHLAHPEDTDAVITRARILSSGDRVEDAVTLLNQEIEKGEDKPVLEDLFLAKSQILIEHQKLIEAEQALDQGLQKIPDSERIQFQLGSVYERAGDFERAEAQFRSILKANPDHPAVLNYLGYMMADRGERLEEALKFIQKAVELEPFNGAYLDSLGWVYFKMNQLQSAETNLIQASTINSSDATVLEHLGDLYTKLGDYLKAREYYQRSISVAEDKGERKKVEDKLALLNKRISEKRN